MKKNYHIEGDELTIIMEHEGRTLEFKFCLNDLINEQFLLEFNYKKEKLEKSLLSMFFNIKGAYFGDYFETDLEFNAENIHLVILSNVHINQMRESIIGMNMSRTNLEIMKNENTIFNTKFDFEKAKEDNTIIQGKEIEDFFIDFDLVFDKEDLEKLSIDKAKLDKLKEEVYIHDNKYIKKYNEKYIEK